MIIARKRVNGKRRWCKAISTTVVISHAKIIERLEYRDEMNSNFWSKK